MFKREPLHEPLSDHLRDLRERGDGFRLPDNYLEDIKRGLPATQAPSPRVQPLYRRPVGAWLAIAASVALLLTLGWAWLYTPTTPPEAPLPLAEANLDALTEEDILAYVEENISDFEIGLLYTEATEFTTESLTDEELDELYYELVE